MCFLSPSHRYATAVKTFRFSSATSPTNTPGVWENISRAFLRKRWMRSPVTHGRVISGNCRILWSEPHCYLTVHRCACRWVKFSMTQATARLAGKTPWSKPSESRLYERSTKAIGSSEALMERQLAWASRGHRSPTRCKGWESLAQHSDGHLTKNAKSLSSDQLCRIPLSNHTPA